MLSNVSERYCNIYNQDDEIVYYVDKIKTRKFFEG